MRRHYYKCPFCLATYAKDFSDDEVTPGHGIMACGICRTRLRYMGAVAEDKTKLESEKVVCKCDERCTNASGPVCNCECHSANHGKGVAGYTVMTVYETVPTLTFSKQELIDKHEKIKEEMQNHGVEVNEMVKQIPGTTGTYFQRRYLQRWDEIIALRSQSTRNKKYEELKVDINAMLAKAADNGSRGS